MKYDVVDALALQVGRLELLSRAEVSKSLDTRDDEWRARTRIARISKSSAASSPREQILPPVIILDAHP